MKRVSNTQLDSYYTSMRISKNDKKALTNTRQSAQGRSIPGSPDSNA